MSETITENKMGTAPVWSLLLKMSLPVILSTAVQALYNIVDGIFVAMISEKALSAITYAMPMFTLMTAVGTGVAVGMNTMLSRALGEKKQKEVNDAASAAIFLVLLTGILALAAGFTPLSGAFMRTQTADPEILEAGVQYLRVCFLFGIGTIGQLVFERMLISTGKTLYSMISQAAGALLNIIFDPILIFGLFGFPKMGITGAAVATVFSQIIAAFIALCLNLRKNREVQLRFTVKPRLSAVKNVLYLGIPSAVLLMLNSFMMFNFNAVLSRFSSTAVAVFGACCRYTHFFYAILNALCSTTIPIVAYNLGAKKKARIDETIRYGYLYGIVMMAIGTVVCCGFPAQLLRLFNATEEMIAIGVVGMRMLCVLYTVTAVRNMSTCVVQALGHSIPSMLVDLSRNYLVLIPAAWLLSLTGVLNMVWLSIPIADFVCAVVGVILIVHYYKKDIKPLEGETL